MTSRPPLQRLLDALLGTPAPDSAAPLLDPAIDPTDEPAANRTPKAPQAHITTQRGTRPLARNALVPDALRRAVEDFITSEARTYIKYLPHTRYRIDQITTYITPQNRPYLADLQNNRPLRKGMALACIRSADGAADVLDTSGFGDWCIEPAPDASADDHGVYTVLAGTGPDQVSLSFVVFGDYVEHGPTAAPTPYRAPPAQPVAGGIAQGANLADQTATLDIATGSGTRNPTPLLTLRIREPGQPEREQALFQLPALIGRGSACAVRLDSPFASRMHACIRASAQGQPVLDATSPKGLRCTADGSQPTLADDITDGQSMLLPQAGTLVLTPAAGQQAVSIGFAQAPAPTPTPTPIPTDTDHTATLAPPPGYPLPSPAPAALASATRPAAAGAPAPAAAPTRLGIPPAASPPKPTRIDVAAPASPAPATLYAQASPAGAIARLVVRHGDGSTEQHLLRELPFVIGREPEAHTGLTLRDPACRTSRQHLRLGKLQGGSMLVENLAATKGGSWAGGQALSPRFAWRLQAPGGREGWVTLGQKEGDGAAVMVRIEHVQ